MHIYSLCMCIHVTGICAYTRIHTVHTMCVHTYNVCTYIQCVYIHTMYVHTYNVCTYIKCVYIQCMYVHYMFIRQAGIYTTYARINIAYVCALCVYLAGRHMYIYAYTYGICMCITRLFGRKRHAE